MIISGKKISIFNFSLQVYYYYPFSALSDPAKLFNDLRWNISRPQGLMSDPLSSALYVKSLNVTYFLTTFRQGLQVQDYFGNFCKRVPTDIDLPAVSILYWCTANLV
jgi:protein transport protein SEC24